MKHILIVFLSLGLVTTAMANKKSGKLLDSAAIEFENGSAMLTSENQNKIRTMVNKSATAGEDLNIGIAAWSDQDFPGKSRLSSDQRDLAQRRIDAVENYIDSLKFDGDLDTYNMAKSSNWLARMFNTKDSELKSMFSRRDVSEDMYKPKYQAYKEMGGAGKVVLVLSQQKDYF